MEKHQRFCICSILSLQQSNLLCIPLHLVITNIIIPQTATVFIKNAVAGIQHDQSHNKISFFIAQFKNAIGVTGKRFIFRINAKCAALRQHGCDCR